MSRILIFGNSGSGKSTLATRLCETRNLAHLDLDTVAWLPGMPPQRKSLAQSRSEIDQFLARHSQWVIEGCYADLLDMVTAVADEVVFLDLPVEQCVANARARPWEPHKYPSKQAQDANLEMLVDWIAQYTQRRDTFSQQAHSAIFAAFKGKKVRYTSNLHDS